MFFNVVTTEKNLLNLKNSIIIILPIVLWRIKYVPKWRMIILWCKSRFISKSIINFENLKIFFFFFFLVRKTADTHTLPPFDLSPHFVQFSRRLFGCLHSLFNYLAPWVSI